jgi:hypothetical protein
MSNMSYCRYRNTLGDLRDCYDAIIHEAETQDGPESDEEKCAKTELIQLCGKIFSEVDADGEFRSESDGARDEE